IQTVTASHKAISLTAFIYFCSCLNSQQFDFKARTPTGLRGYDADFQTMVETPSGGLWESGLPDGRRAVCALCPFRRAGARFESE
ncbi:hypothetical protein, partial [Neisseria meningitidis]